MMGKEGPDKSPFFKTITLVSPTRVLVESINTKGQLTWVGGAAPAGASLDIGQPVTKFYDHRPQVAFEVLDDDEDEKDIEEGQKLYILASEVGGLNLKN